MIELVNALGASRTLPVGLSFPSIPFTRNVPTVSLTGLDGAIRAGRETVNPRAFSIQGSIWYPSTTDVETERDLLLGFLQHTPIQVYRTTDRFMFAYVQGVPLTWIDNVELRMSINMVAYDPFWYGVEVTTDGNVTLDGNAPVRPEVTLNVTSGTAAITLTNSANGDNVVLTDTFSTSDEIVIDNKKMTVTVNGDNKLSITSDEWQLFGITLLPGTNELTANNCTIAVKYRPKWY